MVYGGPHHPQNERALNKGPHAHRPHIADGMKEDFMDLNMAHERTSLTMILGRLLHGFKQEGTLGRPLVGEQLEGSTRGYV